MTWWQCCDTSFDSVHFAIPHQTKQRSLQSFDFFPCHWSHTCWICCNAHDGCLCYQCSSNGCEMPFIPCHSSCFHLCFFGPCLSLLLFEWNSSLPNISSVLHHQELCILIQGFFSTSSSSSLHFPMRIPTDFSQFTLPPLVGFL